MTQRTTDDKLLDELIKEADKPTDDELPTLGEVLGSSDADLNEVVLKKLLAEAEKERAEIAAQLDSSRITIVTMFDEVIVRSFTAKCVRIVDGDTIVCLDNNNEQFKVRFLGVDTPERGEPFYKSAAQFTGKLCFGKTVTIYEGEDKDRWGRMLGFVVVDGVNVSVRLLETGLAKHFKKYNKSDELAEIEARAESENTGIWSIK